MRYLPSCSAYLAEHRPPARWRRPRTAGRPRTYVTHPAGDLAPLALAVVRLLTARGLR
ncbi:hypothetical protein [Nocardiopsis sp. NPDC057823]|uniref:hypothetical protein n=1 Tax=Nocardiopsis sp. NPDC057823 TaxID=3346256 RepID=UPI00367244CE